MRNVFPSTTGRREPFFLPLGILGRSTFIEVTQSFISRAWRHEAKGDLRDVTGLNSSSVGKDMTMGRLNAINQEPSRWGKGRHHGLRRRGGELLEPHYLNDWPVVVTGALEEAWKPNTSIIGLGKQLNAPYRFHLELAQLDASDGAPQHLKQRLEVPSQRLLATMLPCM
jgi:hypothetical protein